MSESKLSPPLECEGVCIERDIDEIYYRFRGMFLDKNTRIKYNGKFIFFNMSKSYEIYENGIKKVVELSKPERFLHIISIGDNDKYTSDPCYNDDSSLLCKNECDIRNSLDEFKILGRTECYYRLLRINRINEVIELANKRDDNIEEWEEEESKTKRLPNGKTRRIKICKKYIRYKHKRDDYVVILKKDNKGKRFDFVTSFPLFNKQSKKEYSKKYKKFIKKK